MHLIYDLKRNSTAHTLGVAVAVVAEKRNAIPLLLLSRTKRVSVRSCVCRYGFSVHFFLEKTTAKWRQTEKKTHTSAHPLACMQFTFRIDESCCFLSTKIQISIWLPRAHTFSPIVISRGINSSRQMRLRLCFFVFRSFIYPIEAIFAEFVIAKQEPTSSAQHQRQCRVNYTQFWGVQENSSSPGPRKTKNDIFSSGQHIRLSQRHRRHVISVGKFFYSPFVELKRKMAPHRVNCVCWAAPNCNESSRSGPTSQYPLAHRKWIMNFSKVHVCYSAEGWRPFRVSCLSRPPPPLWWCY